MHRFKQFLEEKVTQPVAVWVVGGAASGKSTVGENGIVKPLKFVLIDPDKPFEDILKKYKLGTEIKRDTPEEAKRKREEAKAGQRRTVSMKDLKDPLDYFKIKKPSIGGATAVGAEMTRRQKEATIASRQNICFIETGAKVTQIKNLKKQLEEAGYKTFIVYVGIHPELDLTKGDNFNKIAAVIQQRSDQRASGGGRKLEADILKKSLTQMHKVKKDLLPVFGRNKLMIDTSGSSSLTQNINKVKSAVKRLI